jgi:8-oxo-dGTP pyrophosphatase MutT (NUDIX family)
MSDNFNLSGFDLPVPVILTPNITKEQLLSFQPFKTWRETLKASLERQKMEKDHPFNKDPYSLRRVTIQSVDWFGPKIGFVKLTAEIRNETKSPLPGIAFLRGPSVAMLMILRPSDSQTERWVIMTEQPRIPAGSLTFMEIPAGMFEGGTFAGTAAREIKEETGLEVPEKELINLTELALEDEEPGASAGLQTAMYPSPGGSDEYIAIFLWEKIMDRQEIEDLKGKLAGERWQGENITTRMLNYERLWKVGARDAKTLAAWSLYEALKRARHPKLLDLWMG